jgi:hypothetical protein
MHPREAAELHESGGSARNLLEPLLDTLQGRSHHLPAGSSERSDIKRQEVKAQRVMRNDDDRQRNFSVREPQG